MIIFLICFIIGAPGVICMVSLAEIMYGASRFICGLVLIAYVFLNLALCAYIWDLKGRVRTPKVVKKKWETEKEIKLWQED